MGWTVYNSDGKILQSAELGDNAVTTVKIIDDAVTYAKMQNLGTADRVLGSASTGVIGEVQIVPDMLATDAVTNVKVATGIDAVKLADGSVTNAELQYINTLSSNAQTQLAAKAPIASPTFTTGATSPSFITGNSGIIKLMDGNGSNFASIAAHATTTADIAYTWPPAGPGTNGYALTSTTAGVMSWAAGGGDFSNGGDNGALVLGTNDSNSLTLETNNTARMVLAAGGDVTVSTGNVVIGVAGKGIDFSITADTTQGESSPGASMTSELFDDYEEGTWTPGISDNSSGDAGESPEYTTRYASYTKIGRLVFVSCYLRTSDIGELTGGQTARLYGLPYNVGADSAHGRPAVAVSGGSFDGLSAGYNITGRFTGGGSYLRLLVWSQSTGQAEMTVTQFSADGEIYFSGFYTV